MLRCFVILYLGLAYFGWCQTPSSTTESCTVTYAKKPEHCITCFSASPGKCKTCGDSNAVVKDDGLGCRCLDEYDYSPDVNQKLCVKNCIFAQNQAGANYLPYQKCQTCNQNQPEICATCLDPNAVFDKASSRCICKSNYAANSAGDCEKITDCYDNNYNSGPNLPEYEQCDVCKDSAVDPRKVCDTCLDPLAEVRFNTKNPTQWGCDCTANADPVEHVDPVSGQTKAVCECQAGFITQNGACVKGCDGSATSSCSECDVSTNTCKKCRATFQLVSGKCHCPGNTYETVDNGVAVCKNNCLVEYNIKNQLFCQTCDANQPNLCATCADSQAVLKANQQGCQCNSNSVQITSGTATNNTSCANKCTVEFNSGVAKCSSCLPENETLCLVCQDRYAELKNDSLGCACKQGYTDVNGVCVRNCHNFPDNVSLIDNIKYEFNCTVCDEESVNLCGGCDAGFELTSKGCEMVPTEPSPTQEPENSSNLVSFTFMLMSAAFFM